MLLQPRKLVGMSSAQHRRGDSSCDTNHLVANTATAVPRRRVFLRLTPFKEPWSFTARGETRQISELEAWWNTACYLEHFEGRILVDKTRLATDLPLARFECRVRRCVGMRESKHTLTSSGNTSARIPFHNGFVQRPFLTDFTHHKLIPTRFCLSTEQRVSTSNIIARPLQNVLDPFHTSCHQ